MPECSFCVISEMIVIAFKFLFVKFFFLYFYLWNGFRSSIEVLFDLKLLLRQYKRMPECSFCVISEMIVIAFINNLLQILCKY